MIAILLRKYHMTVLLHLYDNVTFLCFFDESLMNNLLQVRCATKS
jgi:hypothetical protein